MKILCKKRYGNQQGPMWGPKKGGWHDDWGPAWGHGAPHMGPPPPMGPKGKGKKDNYHQENSAWGPSFDDWSNPAAAGKGYGASGGMDDWGMGALVEEYDEAELALQNAAFAEIAGEFEDVDLYINFPDFQSLLCICRNLTGTLLVDGCLYGFLE